MNKSLAVTLVLGLAMSESAAAAGGSVTDQAVTLTYGSTHWNVGLPLADCTGVDSTGDPLYQTGWWYRVEGDTQEYPFPTPDSETYVNGQIAAQWDNIGLKGFKVWETTEVLDGEGPSGGFLSFIVARNNNATSKQITFFHYIDVDMAATSGNDSGTLVNSHFIKFSDGTSRVAYRASFPSHYQVSAYPGVRNLLNDAALTTLNDAGLPFGPGDATAAFQFGPFPIPAGATIGVGSVSAMFNAPRDHVKGDYYGLGLASLYGQAPALSGRNFQWMRRASQFGSGYYFGTPGASASLVGVDDFDGDFTDETVFRDTVSGVVYISSAPITGAPTLALNWKLSATGDFNGDGKADILWRNTTSQKLVIWTMNGTAKIGNIIPTPDQAVDANWEVAAAADFNGDGHRDLLWYNQTTGKIVLWFMDGNVVRLTGQFANPATVGNNNWRVAAVGDYGKGAAGLYDTQDIVWQNDTSKKIVVWHMDLAGTRTGGEFTTPDTLASSWDLVGPR